MSQNCPENQNTTAGTATAYKVTGVKNATQFTVSDGKAAAGTILKGEMCIRDSLHGGVKILLSGKKRELLQTELFDQVKHCACH